MIVSILNSVLNNVKNVAGVVEKNGRKAITAVSKSAKGAVDVTKLRLSINEINSSVSKKYNELGQYVYDAKKSGELDESVVTEKINDIDALYTELSVIAQQIGALQNKTICPECGKEISADVSFCPYCGTKIEMPEPVEEEAEIVDEVSESIEEILPSEEAVETEEDTEVPVETEE